MSELKILHEKDLTNQICVAVGTRPGIIKMSPIIIGLQRRSAPFFVIHTGQHYSYEMDQKFFEDLELPSPRHHLPQCRPGSYHGEQTAHMLAGVERVLLEEKPKIVLVCGDANTNLAGALAARKLQIAVGHVESGLRSHDWRMPEEHNRVIIDHISEYLFAPTARAKDNLIKDNVKGRIFVTGNTVVDALENHLPIAQGKSNLLEEYLLKEGDYILITLHREENVDDPKTLKRIIESLELINDRIGLEMVFPLHPRTKDRLQRFKWLDLLTGIQNLKLIPPVGYLDFLRLLSSARMVLTDSGGIQEESCILKVPCVTLRENTERQETVEVGANRIAGTVAQDILQAVTHTLDNPRTWPNPFGDGQAARRIVDVCLGNTPEEWVWGTDG